MSSAKLRWEDWLLLGAMKAEDRGYSTRELSPRTWADFERLFERPGEWAGCWCVYYHRPRPLPKKERESLTREERIAKNRQDHRELVAKGRSHGILVYLKGEPVGWCQYGPREELPRIDAGTSYRRLALKDGGRRLWRISCFCVDRKHRKSGVAAMALKAALESIREKGGGLVEAYPVTSSGALAAWFGTVSMFEREGFEVVAPLGRSNVLMRKAL